MPPTESVPDAQQLRDNIRRTLAWAGMNVDDDRLASLARAVEANLLAGDAIARAVAGDRPPAVFRVPDPRSDD